MGKLEKMVNNDLQKSKTTSKKRKVKLVSGIVLILLALIAAIVLIVVNRQVNESGENKKLNPEIARSMTYDQVEDGDEATSSPYVNFDAFFLRDLNEDGYAESIRGSCVEIGESSTLYMELSVLTQGRLENGVIEINSDNFYFQTAIPADNEVAENAVGNNIKTIKLNTINNGTQKLMTGIVKSGDYSKASKKAAAIGDDISKYSKVNSITLKGTWVSDDGETTEEIEKTVDFTVDWHGITTAEIPNYINDERNLSQEKDITEAINEEDETFELNFDIYIQETANELQISKSVLEGTIPELNGYEPQEVTITGKNVTYTYDEETRNFVAQKEAVLSDSNRVTRNAYDSLYTTNDTDEIRRTNKYTLEIKYPLEAFTSLGADTIEIKIPVQGYYEGYNNEAEEFENPYRSENASEIIVLTYKNPKGDVAIFELKVGNYIYEPAERYIVSKRNPLKLFNGENIDTDNDLYVVRWEGFTGKDGKTSGMIMEEATDEENNAQTSDQFIKSDSSKVSMENITSNVGIYFGDPTNMLGDNGWINVYDNETDELLKTFEKDDWEKYSRENPYMYERPVNHIRVETSDTNVLSTLLVYNIKKIDDEYLIDNFTKEEFDDFKYIQSTLTGYIGDRYVNTDIHQANYEAPFSIATVNISESAISTQSEQENEIITIQTQTSENYNFEKWINGSFLLKMPEEILDLQVNGIEIDNNNVEIISYEIYEENGFKYIKINTENETEETYQITIDCDIVADPRISTQSDKIELYSANENASDYYYIGQDIYDVNNNLNIDEQIGKTDVSISFVSPGSLLTNQTASNFDEEQNIAIGPQVADIEKNNDEDRTATIEVQLRNNYSNTVSNIVVLGKIPFEGNTYVLNGGDLNSTFSTTITNNGINVPEVLKEQAIVYYSENENPTKDIEDENNNWKLAEDVEDWSTIKTYLIDLNGYVMEKDEELTFSYVIQIPKETEYNEVSYSHHAVYFALDTEDGKYETQIEANKLGFRIAKKYDLEIIKYQKDKEKVVSGATYKITEISEDGTEISSKTAVTDLDGKLVIKDLYGNINYKIEEIKSPTQYTLNEGIIEIIGHIREDGSLEFEAIDNNSIIRNEITLNESTLTIEVEDEVKANLKLIKTEEGTDNSISKVKFKITGKGIVATGRILITDSKGEAELSGLEIGEEYTIEELAAEGYYLENPIKFKVLNNNGTYEIELTEGEAKQNNIIVEDEVPVANIEIENRKIPTYNLEISKVSSVDQTPLEGAILRLYKGTEKIGDYTTDSDGKIIIEGLYLYEETENIDQTYTLKEIQTPEGYAAIKDIVFRVKNENGNLIIENKSGSMTQGETIDNTVTMTIEDSPIFKLVKKDGETGELLPNTKFVIYNMDNGTEQLALDSKFNILGEKEIIDGKEYYTLTTNENGEIVADLRQGLYKAIEVQASDDKYMLTDEEYYFGIGEENELGQEKVINYNNVIGDGTSSFGGSTISSIISTTDGGYIVTGYFKESTVNIGTETYKNTDITGKTYDGIVIKYDTNGDIEWSKLVGGEDSEYLDDVSETADGGFVVSGNSLSSNIKIGDSTSIINESNEVGIVIQFESSGKIKWANKVEGTGNVYMWSVLATKDGGALAEIDFTKKVIIGDETISSSGVQDVLIVKYDAQGNINWTNKFGSARVENITSIIELKDGGYIISGKFISNSYSSHGGGSVGGGGTAPTSMKVGDKTLTHNGSGDGLIVKYDVSGNVEWAKSIGGSSSDEISNITTTSDGDVLVGLTTSSTSINLDGTIINSSGSSKGILIKYDSVGNLQWAKNVNGSIKALTETKDKEIVIKHSGSSNLIKYDSDGNLIGEIETEIENANYINNLDITSDGGILVGRRNGHVTKILENIIVPEQSEIVVTNNRKEFRIRTEVEAIDGIKGGTISGENTKPYEIVKYGDSSTKEILMVPDEGYEIISITVNGEEYLFEANDDGTYKMPQFENMTEDKTVVVKYASTKNKIIINKVDSQDNEEKLQGATFEIQEVEYRTEPGDVTGEIVANGQHHIEVDESKEINDSLGGLTANGTYYFVENEAGQYVPTNSITYQKEHGGTEGIGNSTANSYMKIDLSDKTGTYAVKVNAKISSELACDYGYATITESTTAPKYNESTGRFIYTHYSGTNDYVSEMLEGGKVYYLHFGYMKDPYVDTGEDQLVINSVNLYEAESITYNFVDNGNGGYESNNQGEDNKTANSYIPIDLTGLTGKYNITVNAEISSEKYDYGYATVTTTTTAPNYYTSTGRFIYISEEQEAQDYTTVVEGGQMYYLHLGYYKGSSASEGEDKFTINSISVSLSDADIYFAEVTTNSEGQGIAQIPYGDYAITETKAPDGYEALENPVIIEFKEDGNVVVTNDNNVSVTVNDAGEFVIENNESGKVIVHHYLKDRDGTYTTTKVAEDELLEGKIDEGYTTSPKLDLEEYELEKDENGDYVVPENASGTYEPGVIEVNYYYEEKDIPLTVHHYIEGTEDPVPLKDGTEAKDVIDTGKEGDAYTTTQIPDEDLSDEYELVEIPVNAEGTYSGDEVIVTYYYRLVERDVTLIKTGEENQALSGVTFDIIKKAEDGGEDIPIGTYTTDDNGKISVNLEVGTYEVVEIATPEEYELPENPITNITITRDTTDEELKITNEKIKGQVIVHHYIEGSTDKVPSKEDGKVVEDEIKEGNVGEIYATKESENVSPEYDFVEAVGQTNGEYIDGTIEVIYYYKMKNPIITSEITKTTTTEKILSASDEVTYEINYTTTITDYIGDATVTIVDYLPYEIDLENSDIAEGTYDDETRTITWTEEVKGIDTDVAGAKEVNISKTITIVYGNLDEAGASITNRVEGTVELQKPEKTDKVEDEVITPAEIPGKLIVKYLEEGTDRVLAEQEEITGRVGTEYTTEQKEIEGYDFIRVVGNETGNLTERTIEVIYYYKIQDVNITENTITKGGTTSIDERTDKVSYNLVYEGRYIKDRRKYTRTNKSGEKHRSTI